MKRLFIVVAILMIAGCTLVERGESQFFTTTDGLVEFQFPDGWFTSKKNNPYELQCFSKDRQMTTGVFVFARVDLAKNTTPEEILDLQIEDLSTKRQGFKILEDKQTVQIEKKTLTTIVYSGETDIAKYYYRFTLVEFTKSPEIFVVVIQVAIPSRWKEHKPILEQITASARMRLSKS